MNNNRVNIDSVKAAVAPWDFAVEFRGETHATRPLTLGDLATLETLRVARNPDDLERLIAYLEGVFIGTPPEVRAWTMEQVTAVLIGMGAYVQERQARSQAALGAAIAKTLESRDQQD